MVSKPLPLRPALLLQLPLLCLLNSTINNHNTAVQAFNPIRKIQNDYRALTRRVTARQILLPPNSEEALQRLKLSILRRVETPLPKEENDGGPEEFEFIVTVFEEAAKKYSRDDTTSPRGALIGELVPQGTCRSAIIDAACFRVPLGAVYGPMESEFGLHLLLVSERLNCPKLDGTKTKLIPPRPGDTTGYGHLVPSSATTLQESQVTPSFLVRQVAFWVFVLLSGGILAELAAKVGGPRSS